MFWLRNKKVFFWYALLNKGLDYVLICLFFSAIELEAERAKIVQMQSVYEAQEFSPDDVEKINMRRRELQRQIDEVNKQCEMEDKEIWSMEMALTKEMEQVKKANHVWVSLCLTSHQQLRSYGDRATS